MICASGVVAVAACRVALASAAKGAGTVSSTLGAGCHPSAGCSRPLTCSTGGRLAQWGNPNPQQLRMECAGAELVESSTVISGAPCSALEVSLDDMSVSVDAELWVEVIDPYGNTCLTRSLPL